jgi:hypothetical protein
MKLFFKFCFLFLFLTIAVALTTRELGFEFGQDNYWDNHGLFFLVFLALFPRLTLLFSSVVSSGIIWWLGWLFAPRLLVAALATFSYWHQNPALVVMAWLVALGGESSEKTVFLRRGRMSRVYTHKQNLRQSTQGEPDVIETTAKRL